MSPNLWRQALKFPVSLWIYLLCPQNPHPWNPSEAFPGRLGIKTSHYSKQTLTYPLTGANSCSADPPCIPVSGKTFHLRQLRSQRLRDFDQSGIYKIYSTNLAQKVYRHRGLQFLEACSFSNRPMSVLERATRKKGSTKVCTTFFAMCPWLNSA